MDWAYSLAGLVVGIVVGLTGIGGGSLMTPLLMLAFGVSPAVAVGTDLLCAAVTKTGGTLVHALQGSVDWRVVASLAAGSIPASLAVIIGLSQVTRGGGAADGLLAVALGTMLILTALSILLKTHLQRIGGARARQAAVERRSRPIAIASVGALIGAAVSLSSVGAGAIGVAALVFLCPFLKGARIVGTDIAHAVPLTLVAGLGHAAIGHVDWGMLGWLLLGSIPGVAVGSLLVKRLPEALVRYSLALLLMLTGSRMLLR